MGSLIGAILKNYDLQKAIEIGSAAAAIVVTKVGCAPAMPDLDEVLDFMKNNKKNCKWVSGKDFNNFQYHYELEDESKEIIDERNTTLQEILHTAFMYIVTIPEKTDMNGIILNKGDEIDCIKIYVIDKSKKQRFIREGERPVADGKPTIAPRFKF